MTQLIVAPKQVREQRIKELTRLLSKPNLSKQIKKILQQELASIK